jgi:hypothetical protein
MEPGNDMKRVYAITLFAAVLVAVAVSGCTGLFDGGSKSTPVPTVYGPLPSPLPTPTPTPVPGAAITHSKPSNDVNIITSPMDYKVVTGGRTKDGKQFEDIYLVVENTGTQTAEKVMLTVTIINENNLNMLVYQQFPVGDLSRGERKAMNLTTGVHEYTNFIKLTIETEWGKYSEYYRSVPFEDTFSNLVV